MMKVTTLSELTKMVSDLSRLRPGMFEISRTDDAGDFVVTLELDPEFSAAARSNIAAICERLRKHYRLRAAR